MFNLFKRKKNYTVELVTSLVNNQKTIYSPNDLVGIKEYEELKAKDDTYIKVEFLNILAYYEKFLCGSTRKLQKSNYYTQSAIEALLAGIQRKKLNYTEEEWIQLFDVIKEVKTNLEKKPSIQLNLSFLPINYIIKQIEYLHKKGPISNKLKIYISNLLEWKEFSSDGPRHYYGNDLNKSARKLKALLHSGENAPEFFLKSEDVGDEINGLISKIHLHKEAYHKVFNLASVVSGGKPTEKFKKSVNTEIEKIGVSSYRKLIHSILKVPVSYSPTERHFTSTWQNQTHHHVEVTFLSSHNQTFLKGLVWSCNKFSDRETIRLLTKLAEKSYTKLPGVGPAAAALGNACVYLLGNMRGKDGLGALSRLKLKVRQNNVKKSIDKYLNEGASKYNVSIEELKEMAVPSYSLYKGQRDYEFDDYTLQVNLSQSKVKQQWIKPDGNPMKSVPALIKNTSSLKKKLLLVRKELKEIQKVYTSQKQRIDNQFILDRIWDYSTFNKYYIEHGLVFPIATKLIWSFSQGQKFVNAIYLNNKWTDINGIAIEWITESTIIKLWHPISSNEETILLWRQKMLELEWKQPVKQAYREIYILTQAEINTKTYSNRMAAHILKQHQFSTLANLRDWKYSLMGAYDDGIYNQTCYKEIKEHNLKIEFWIDELNQEDAYNDTGIWHYVATDQVKFKNLDGNLINLEDVAKIVFTEVMRDVDMFVGVCSVGNDPQWMDNNGARQANRDYWESYSFGDLTEIAKTRKEILENLLPRLKKIRDVARIEGKFLIVRGKVRTYKIHIGSGNILMEPNDQYLCIVPSRSTVQTDRLFIPFEGDRGLSIVLSKAFLLAEDDKIEDETIVSQISRFK